MSKTWSLNAPSGAGCFLALPRPWYAYNRQSFNAPSGAGCFLTLMACKVCAGDGYVLMHLLVLGAF